MSISIVIPTHNRAELVRQAIYTILKQTIQDFELIIFDNASGEDLKKIISDFKSSKIRYYRSDDFLSVTESWNRAIDFAIMDYVILLGDDDGLLPNSIKNLQKIINDYERPDIIYSSVLQYFHPGVAPWCMDGYVSLVKNGIFFKNLEAPKILNSRIARKCVLGSLKLRRVFSFNMQAFVFKRDFLNKIRVNGLVFHSPFPDYYLANVSFYLSSKILISPIPFAIQGVSKLSFGFTLFNNLEMNGEKILNNNHLNDEVYYQIKEKILPGNLYNKNYIITMQYILNSLKKFKELIIDFRHYRLIEIIEMYRTQKITHSDMKFFSSKYNFNIFEKFFIYFLICSERNKIFKIIFSKILKKINMTGFDAIVKDINVGGFMNTIELYNGIESAKIKY